MHCSDRDEVEIFRLILIPEPEVAIFEFDLVVMKLDFLALSLIDVKLLVKHDVIESGDWTFLKHGLVDKCVCRVSN